MKALQPHHYKPGQSGNPQGFPRSRREQLETIERLAREASPEMIEILQEMARHSEDDRVRTMAATKLLEFLPKVKEDSAGEGSFAAKLEKMSPRELREWLIGECEDISRIEVPEGFILSPEDSARHEVVRAALAKAVHGIAVIGGRLVDRDALDRLRDADLDAETIARNPLGLKRYAANKPSPVSEIPHPVGQQAPNTDRLSHTCMTCGGSFEAKRSDAKFCSVKCQVAAHRASRASASDKR